MKVLFAILILALQLGAQTVINGSRDWRLMVAPGNPGSNYLRMFANTATGKLECKDSTGANCMASGAPTDAQYVTLATNSSLSAERVLTAGTGLTLTDAGANGAATLAFNPFDDTSEHLIEHFMTGNTTNRVGLYQWTWGNYDGSGGGYFIASESGHNGIYRVITGGADNNASYIKLGDSLLGLYRPDLVAGWEVQALVRVATITSAAAFVGLASNFLFYEGVAVKFDTDASETTWHCYAANGGTSSKTDTTVTVTTGWHLLRLRSTVAGTIRCSVDGSAEVTVNTNLPDTYLLPWVEVHTRETAAKTIDIDRFVVKWATGR